MNKRCVVIKMFGNQDMAGAIAPVLFSSEVSKLKLENAVLRKNRDILRKAELERLRSQVNSRSRTRRKVRKVKKLILDGLGLLANKLEDWGKR